MNPKPVFAFVLMPFRSEFDDVYGIGIKEAAEAAGVRAERLDEQLYSEGMLERIYRQIEVADVIVADMSGRNPNVLYELGYAHAKDKLCVLITDEAENIPFDLKHRRHIVYGESLTFLREELTRHLDWARQEVETRRESQLRVELNTRGDLAVDEYRAEANVEFTIDIHNDSIRESPEIHGIYFYLGNDWRLRQDANECPKTAADHDVYVHRYMLKPPMTRLVPKGWGQVRVKGSRILAVKWRGEEILDTYSLSGRALVRLLTGKGNFDFELSIDVTVDHLPF